MGQQGYLIRPTRYYFQALLPAGTIKAGERKCLEALVGQVRGATGALATSVAEIAIPPYPFPPLLHKGLGPQRRYTDPLPAAVWAELVWANDPPGPIMQ